MAITPSMSSASRQLSNRYSTNYDSLIDDMITLAGSTFTEYNRTVYVDYVQRITDGPYELPGSLDIFTANKAADLAQHQILINNANAWDDDPQRPVMIDLELYDMSTEADTAIPVLQQLITMWREQTGRQIGMYRLVPYYRITEAVALYTAIAASDLVAEAKARSTLVNYMKINDRNGAKLWDYVDFVVPKCYVQYSSWMAQWKYVTAVQISEAIRFARGKPVYPILWYMYQSDDPQAEMTEADYIAAVQYVSGFPGISGTILWKEETIPLAFSWTDVAADLIAGTAEGDFPDPVVPP